jgi:biopolymer transport protein ExbD
MAVAAREDDQVMSELNTTPLIDVMLVLLIMFIITIPIRSHSVPIDLPTDGPAPVVNLERNKLVVDSAGAAYWNGQPVSNEALAATLNQVAAMPVQPELHFQPDAETRYDRVDELLALIKRANVGVMGMVGNERYARF